MKKLKLLEDENILRNDSLYDDLENDIRKTLANAIYY